MSEQRLEVLKLQLQEEVEDPFRAKLHAAEAEVSRPWCRAGYGLSHERGTLRCRRVLMWVTVFVVAHLSNQ